jgi:hypothetical protein
MNYIWNGRFYALPGNSLGKSGLNFWSAEKHDGKDHIQLVVTTVLKGLGASQVSVFDAVQDLRDLERIPFLDRAEKRTNKNCTAP